jgi:hypothetical protein
VRTTRSQYAAVPPLRVVYPHNSTPSSPIQHNTTQTNRSETEKLQNLFSYESDTMAIRYLGYFLRILTCKYLGFLEVFSTPNFRRPPPWLSFSSPFPSFLLGFSSPFHFAFPSPPLLIFLFFTLFLHFSFCISWLTVQSLVLLTRCWIIIVEATGPTSSPQPHTPHSRYFQDKFIQK